MERGGVLGAMDTMYQRSRIQDESMYYEHKKHDGSLPLIGVNTFLGEEGKHIFEALMEELRYWMSTTHIAVLIAKARATSATTLQQMITASLAGQ